MNGRNSLQSIALELFDYISESNDSPYKWGVLEAAKNRCNGTVSGLLASSKDRRDGFDDVFQAARKLHGLGSALCNEGNFGDNALYWLNPTNGNGVTFKYSSDWLRCRFHCAAVKVRTDHRTNNPESKPFTREVDANLVIYFDPPKAGYPKRIGGDWLIKNKEGEGTWTFIPDSEIDVDMAATDILQVVSEGPSLRFSSERIGAAMQKLGFVQRATKGRRGYRVVRYKPEEIEANRRLLALDVEQEEGAGGAGTS
jgi:hypothetical protein